MFGWRWIASELDPASVAHARANVAANGLADVICVVQVDSPECALRAAIAGANGPAPTFTMCNPPFFEDASEASQHPHRNTAITQSEAATSGGEVAFVSRIVMDSVAMQSSSIEWYTSLCGKKASLKPLKALLRQHGVPMVRSARLRVGRTHRWVLAWSFCQNAAAVPAAAAAAAAPICTAQPRQLFDRVKRFLDEQLCLTMTQCDSRTLSLTCTLGDRVVELSACVLLVERPDKWVLKLRFVSGDQEMFAELEKMILAHANESPP